MKYLILLALFPSVALAGYNHTPYLQSSYYSQASYQTYGESSYYSESSYATPTPVPTPNPNSSPVPVATIPSQNPNSSGGSGYPVIPTSILVPTGGLQVPTTTTPTVTTTLTMPPTLPVTGTFDWYDLIMIIGMIVAFNGGFWWGRWYETKKIMEYIK